MHIAFLKQTANFGPVPIYSPLILELQRIESGQLDPLAGSSSTSVYSLFIQTLTTKPDVVVLTAVFRLLNSEHHTHYLSRLSAALIGSNYFTADLPPTRSSPKW